MKYSICIFIGLLVIACSENRGKTNRTSKQEQAGNFMETALKSEIPALTYEGTEPVVIEVPPYTPEGGNIIESYRFIPLETNENSSFMGDIEKLYTDDGYIFIFSRDSKKVLQFTDDGEFVRGIGKPGRGRQEYTEIWDFALDKEVRRICLLDLKGRKMLYYDYSGNYIGKEPLYYLFTHLEFEKDKRYVYTGSAHNRNVPTVDLHRLVVADNEQRPLYLGFPITERERENFHMELQSPIRKFADGIYYNSLVSDTIWKIDSDRYIPSYVLEFPRRGGMFSPADRENMTDELYRRRIGGADWFTGRYLVGDDIVVFLISDNESGKYPLLYSRKTGKVMCGPGGASLNPVAKYSFDPLPAFVFQDSAFASVCFPLDAKRVVRSATEERFNKISGRDRWRIKNLGAVGNPVLVVVKYKEF